MTDEQSSTERKRVTEISETDAIELVQALVDAVETIAKGDARIAEKHGKAIREIQKQLPRAKDDTTVARGIETTKPATKSHTTELPRNIDPTKVSKRISGSPYTSPSKPTTPFHQRPRVQKKTGTTSSARKKSAQPKGKGSGRVKCKICGYSAKNLGALSKHRAKNHPNAAKKSAKKGASTRKNKPQATINQPFYNPTDYAQRAAKLQQQRRSK